MHAMQYEITLPADYDMGIIRHRVATLGSSLDTFPGLGMKAYLVRERDVEGSPVNQYAPFYLWNELAGMNALLNGPGFERLCRDFGRPVVQHWTGLALERGPAHDAVPRVATRRLETLPVDRAPGPAIERALVELREQASSDGVHSAALALDARHWGLVRFALWEEAAPAGAGERYEVLHVSKPELGALPSGRHW
jgi:hypothetical protein